MEEELRSLIHLMLLRKASDAHFTLQGGILHFHLRCLGCMDRQDDGLFDGHLFQYLKYIANLDLGESAKPQSGNFNRIYQGRSLEFRFSLLCTNEVQTGVLRLLDHCHLQSLKDICTDSFQERVFQSLCKGRQGLVLFSGPTGSGKTTTLHVLLRTASLQYHRQVISLEDPIEIRDAAYLQLQINEKSGFTYEAGIEQLLRHDPDIIMLGEIRNAATAQMAIRAALSGHSVFSTVHAKTCAEVLVRMQEFGIPEQQLHAALTFVSTQRLVTLRSRQERRCVYEILYGQQLVSFFQTDRLSIEHKTMKDLLWEAYLNGEITEETYSEECTFE